jgi:hypothetical protein
VAIVTVPEGAAWIADALLDAVPVLDAAAEHPPSSRAKQARPMKAFSGTVLTTS